MNLTMALNDLSHEQVSKPWFLTVPFETRMRLMKTSTHEFMYREIKDAYEESHPGKNYEEWRERDRKNWRKMLPGRAYFLERVGF